MAAADNIACSLQGRAETVSAFHRKLRERTITQKELGEIIAQFETDTQAGTFTWLPVSPAVIARAVKGYATLPASTALRASDAIHLATAAENGLPEIYSNDARLLAASAHFGLKGVTVI